MRHDSQNPDPTGFISRRRAISIGAIASMASLAPAARSARTAGSLQPATAPIQAAVGQHYPTSDPARVLDFVTVCHSNLDRVRGLLAEDAGLAQASWDWGFGDWESAIGAASHVGRTDIIELLLTHGARPTHFTLASLDKVDALRAYLDAVPSAIALEGPHSISLVAHARAGKADRVLEYLSGLGLSDVNPFATDPAIAPRYSGEYAWGSGEDARVRVEWKDRSGCLGVQRPGAPTRNLMPIGEHEFSPAGARHALLRFDAAGDRASSLTILGVGPAVVARRVDG